MAKKGQHAEEPEHKSEGAGGLRWLLTYADMITLLLAFFIVLVGSMETSKAKYTIISAQAQRVFGGGQKSLMMGSKGMLDGGHGLAPFPTKTEPGKGGKDGGQETFNVTVTDYGVLISGGSDVLFDSGSAGMKPQAKDAVKQPNVFDKYIAGVNTSDKCVIIKGHTDDRPISSSVFPSNWELSTARAASVARFLIDEMHVSPAKVTTAGAAYTEPIDTNSTEEGRKRNRRVELWVLNGKACNLMSQMKDASKKVSDEFKGL